MVVHRINVEDAYAAALGRAVYTFSYLEWAIAWTGDALAPGFLDRVVKQTAGQTANDFKTTVASCGRDPTLVAELGEYAETFAALVLRRNDLIHSTPHTAEDGQQRLLRQKKQIDWTLDEIAEATSEFEALAIIVNRVFHDRLQVTKHG